MTPQQQIRELRNKLLGEPKLEFGCEVEVSAIYAVPEGFNLKEKLDKARKESIVVPYVDEKLTPPIRKILGKPVSTNDLLRKIGRASCRERV